VSASRAPLLHPLAHHPDCSHHASLNSSITAQWYENTEGEVRDEEERTLPRLRQRPSHLPAPHLPSVAVLMDSPLRRRRRDPRVRDRRAWRRAPQGRMEALQRRRGRRLVRVFFRLRLLSLCALLLTPRSLLSVTLAPFCHCRAGTSTRTARVPGTRPCTIRRRTDTLRLRDEMHAHRSRPLVVAR
jgi:hypothetical protein